MKKFLIIALLWFAPTIAYAANVNIDGLPAASSVAGADLLECEQSSVNHKCTATQTAAYIYGLMSGDATASGVGAVTFATVNSNVGTFGSSTQCTVITVNAKGLITAASQTACAGGGGGTGANPTATAGPTAVNGSATTFLRSDGAPAIQLGTSGQKGIVQVDGTTITATAGIISATSGSGTVTNVATGCGLSGGPITTTGTVIVSAAINAQVGTTYTVQSTDCGQLVSLTNASAIAVTLPQATGSFTTGWYSTFINQGAGLITITPTTSTIDGLASITLAQFQSIDIISNGTNYIAARGRVPNGLFTTTGALKGNGAGAVSQAACADLSNGTTLCSTTPGTGVATAAAAALSSVGGLTSTIASGTSALGTGAISSATCATVVTTTATNTATTDVVLASFNGDPTAVTGYVPLTTGMLTIIAYPTSNNVNFKVCNNTTSPITPGAITLNWRVLR